MKTNLSVRRLLLLVFCCAVSVQVHAGKLSYEPSNDIVLNPERGLAKFMLVGNESIGDIDALRDDNHTLAWGIIKLDPYRTTATLPQSTLLEIKNWLKAIKRNRVKAVLRVAYHESTDFLANGASLDIQESHLTQLGREIFVPYQDVIVALQAGGIGAYGEWYYTTPALASAQSRKRLIDKMYSVVSDDTFVLVRTPYYKQQYAASGALDNRVNRTGHYNDCFLSNSDDMGTYLCYPYTESCPTIAQLQKYSSNEATLVPVGGETCNSTTLNDCAATLASMSYYGYSFINTLWFSSIRSKWEEQGCFGDITKHLGYRYELVSAEVPDRISAGTYLSVTVSVKNTGWAPMYRKRAAYIRMADASGRSLQVVRADVDPRTWVAGDETYTFITSFEAPANLNTESVSLSLWMPDSNPDNHQLPEYSVRFANKGVWNPVTGDNVLVQNVQVMSNISDVGSR